MHDDSQARGLSVLIFSFCICYIFRKLSYWYSRKSSIWMNWDFYKAGGENWPILSSYSKKEEICDQIYNLAGLCPIFQQWSRNSLREKFRELRFLPEVEYCSFFTICVWLYVKGVTSRPFSIFDDLPQVYHTLFEWLSSRLATKTAWWTTWTKHHPNLMDHLDRPDHLE